MKYLKFFACAGFALALTCACGDDPVTPNPDGPTEEVVDPDDPETDPKNAGDGTGEISSNALSPADQQAKMQAVAKDFLGCFKASDFQYWVDLSFHIGDQYVDNDYFDNDVVEDWFEDLAEVTKLGTRKNNGGYQDWTGAYHYWEDIYTQQEKLIKLANIKGKFTAELKGWKRETASNLQFIAKDHNGDKIEATLTTSGSSKKVRLYSDTDWRDYEMIGNTSYYYYDENTYIVEVPEVITLSFKAAGKERMKVTMNTKLDSLKEDKIYVNTTSIAASTTMKIDDYTCTVSNLAYTPNDKAGVDATFSKGNTLLMSASVNVSDWNLSGDGPIDDFEDGEFLGGKGTIRFNVMNKIQLNATVTNARAFADAIDEADYDDEAKMKAAANKMNRYMKAGLYYGTKDKQADFRFEPFETDRWYNSYYGGYRSEWSIYPVIAFADGSSYSLFEETAFFNENAFDSVIKLFNQLVEDFERLVD